MENSANKFIEEMNEANEAMGVKKIETNLEVKSESNPIKSEISYDDYLKLDIRICEIVSVEKVEKKDNLYKLEINTGIDTRVVVSGIAQEFTPEQLLNKKFPFILNLPIRAIAKIDSFGMIILSRDSNKKLNKIGDENAEIGSLIVE